jgi:Mrp family chromosome partitioning ATPase
MSRGRVRPGVGRRPKEVAVNVHAAEAGAMFAKQAIRLLELVLNGKGMTSTRKPRKPFGSGCVSSGGSGRPPG